MKWTELGVLLCLLVAVALAKSKDAPEQSVKDKNDEDAKGDWYANYDKLHPCAEKKCGLGYECDLDEDGQASCVCIRKCHHEGTPIKVCTVQNMTFDSECDFYRQKCLCNTNNPECQDVRYRADEIDYFGPCKELEQCTQEELEEFPSRMRDWLFLVMEELDRRNDLGNSAHSWVEEAKRMKEHKWVLPVIWKFCDLDVSHDREVNSNELFPITAPLKPLEHCTVTFIKQCDSNSNGEISLSEWGLCLGLSQDEIQDRCDELTN